MPEALGPYSAISTVTIFFFGTVSANDLPSAARRLAWPLGIARGQAGSRPGS